MFASHFCWRGFSPNLGMRIVDTSPENREQVKAPPRACPTCEVCNTCNFSAGPVGVDLTGTNGRCHRSSLRFMVMSGRE